jgi:hypothetical protein
MQNLIALANELHHARRISAATGDPLLRTAAYDAWRRFKNEKRNRPEHAGAADSYYRSLLRGHEQSAGTQRNDHAIFLVDKRPCLYG